VRLAGVERDRILIGITGEATSKLGPYAKTEATSKLGPYGDPEATSKLGFYANHDHYCRPDRCGSVVGADLGRALVRITEAASKLGTYTKHGTS